jgi:hypothetical protein
MPGPDVPCSHQKEKARASATLPDAGGGVLRQRDECQSDGGFRNDCPCVLALTCIHDIVPVFDGENLLCWSPKE